MGDTNDVLDAALKKSVMAHQFKSISFGIATNIRDGICDVTRVDDEDLLDVRLHGVEDGLSSFIRVKPKDGSVVIVGIIDHINTEACVLQCSEIDEVMVKIGNIEMVITTNGIVFNGGQNKGIPKLTPLVTKLNTIEQSLTALKQVFTNWTVVPSDGGAALKTAVSTWAGQAITGTTEADLENTNVKQ